MSNSGLELSLEELLQRHKEFSARGRAAVDEEIQNFVNNLQNEGFSGHQVSFDHITNRYTHSHIEYPMIFQEINLHDVWYEVIQVFKHTVNDHEDQNILVLQLVSLISTGNLRPENESFSDGRKLWSELPFFSPDLIEEFTARYWNNSDYNATQRDNMAGAIGRLLSVGIYDGPALCALSLFRHAFRPHDRFFPREDADSRQGAPLTVKELIKHLTKIAEYSGNGLILLASNVSGAATSVPHLNYASVPALSSHGDLAIQPGLFAPDLCGYSSGRWAFWKKRLEELSTYAGATSDDSEPNFADDLGYVHGHLERLEEDTRMLE